MGTFKAVVAAAAASRCPLVVTGCDLPNALPFIRFCVHSVHDWAPSSAADASSTKGAPQAIDGGDTSDSDTESGTQGRGTRGVPAAAVGGGSGGPGVGQSPGPPRMDADVLPRVRCFFVGCGSQPWPPALQRAVTEVSTEQ